MKNFEALARFWPETIKLSFFDAPNFKFSVK